MSNMAISNIVHSVRNIMRRDPGVDGDAQRISQMTWMIFLKVFDSMEQEKEAEDSKYQSPLPEEIRWRNWADDEEGITGEELLDFVNKKIFEQIKNLDVENDRKAQLVKQVFEDTYNYMKNGVLMRQVINEINKIDFTSSKDRHLFNDIYETILRELQSAGSAGEFYTPRAVTQFIVDMVNPKLGEIVLDPACGTGGFLVSTLENMRKEVDSVEELQKLGKNIRGIEKKPLPHLLCMTNLMLHDIEEPNIKHDNSLSKPLREYSSKDMIDCVVTNPPFGGAEEEGIENNFPNEFQTRETADLFLVLIMKLLRDEGRCGIVLPESPVNEGVRSRVFEKLLNEFNLHTIVRLPEGVFSPYTDINTNLLFFEKGKPTKEIWYFFHPVPEKLKYLKNPRYSKTKPITYEEFNLEKEWWNNREDKKFEKYSYKINKKDIVDRGYDLWIRNPHEKKESNLLDKKELIENIKEGLLKIEETLNNIEKKDLKESVSWEEVEIKSFLEERTNRFKPEEANSLNLKRLNKIDFSGKMHLLENKKTNTNMILIKPGDLVISGINVEKGAVAVYQGDEEILATIHYSSYILDKSKIDQDFLKFYLKSNIFKEIINRQVRGGIKTELKPKKFLPLNIKIPDLKSQIKIVGLLKVGENLEKDFIGIQNKVEFINNSIFNELYSNEIEN